MEWKGEHEKLDQAFEKAAEQAPEGQHQVRIEVKVHRNKEGETGPNPISSYIVSLGGGGG